VPDIADSEACGLLLPDLHTRAAFALAVRQYTETLGIVLPRPEALRYVPDARRLGLINARARLRYRDEELSLHGAGAKVRRLIDEHLVANGIESRIRPISILAADFDAVVAAQGSARSQASEMEHAARHHITRHYGEDPARYRMLSERLEELLERFSDNWEQLALHLHALIEEARRGRAPDPFGLDPVTEAPFRDVLTEALAPDGALEPADGARLAEATRELVAHLRGEVGKVDFWRNPVAQGRLRGWLTERLDERNLVPLERQAATADLLVELARQRHAWLVG
jgi:type I restriction enzyme R subunit